MNRICRNHFIVILLVLATTLSLLHNFSSTRRAISSSQEFYIVKDKSVFDNAPYVSSSKLHYMWDEKLETRYSTTHQKIRGHFSLILNDNDETNNDNNDFQHRGILRTSSDKHGKWMDIRHLPPDIEFTVAGETIRKAGTNYSKFVDDMRLVIDANQTIMFPSIEREKMMMNEKTDNNHLCHLLRVLTGRKSLSLDAVPKKGIPPIVLNVTADCNILNKQMNGQGNTILALYGLRMVTALAKVDFQFQCKNNDFEGESSATDIPNDYKKQKSRKLRWVFPWFASYQSAANDRDPWPYTGDAPTQDQVCLTQSSNRDNSNENIPLEKMADQIRNDVRKMSLQLIGSRTKDPKRVHPLIPLDVEPWIPDIAPDDVIIHLPCYSDLNSWVDGTTILRTTKRGSRVGILQFNEYTKHINKNVKTIGIIQEASEEPSRSSDEDVCHLASTLLLEYLQSFFTNLDVSISIYENDTLPLQYARIAMAKQSFSSFSTFGMIPIIGTFGEGYFQPSDSNTHATTSGYVGKRNSIIENIISGKYKGFENLNLMNGNVLSPENILTMSFSDISNWLLNDSP